MLPPGNSSGLTTKVSVETRSRCRRDRDHRAVAELRQDRVAEVRQEAVAQQRGAQLAARAVAELHPLGARPSGTGQARPLAMRDAGHVTPPPGRGRAEAAVVVVGGAGALGRDHRRAERVLRRAAGAEGGALVRLELAPQHLAGAALAPAPATLIVAQAEAQLGVEVGELLAQREAAPRDRRRCRATCRSTSWKTCSHQVLRRRRALAAHRRARTGSPPRAGPPRAAARPAACPRGCRPARTR